MTGFTPDWLALREPADHAARSAGLTARLADALAGRDRLTIIDLGCGSGSNLRALAPLLPGPQHWRLIDSDPALLAIAAAAQIRDRDGQPVALEAHRADLAAPGWEGLCAGADLVTMSALLDLVGADFLARLARLPVAAIHAVLTVDGRMGCTPPDPLDDAVFAAFRDHMGGDKGFGPALGPAAADVAARMLAGRGFDVATERSDWRIGPEAPALASALLDGWVEAAAATGLVDGAALEVWAKRRKAEIDAGSVELRVGHVDLLAVDRLAIGARGPRG